MFEEKQNSKMPEPEAIKQDVPWEDVPIGSVVRSSITHPDRTGFFIKTNGFNGNEAYWNGKKFVDNGNPTNAMNIGQKVDVLQVPTEGEITERMYESVINELGGRPGEDCEVEAILKNTQDDRHKVYALLGTPEDQQVKVEDLVGILENKPFSEVEVGARIYVPHKKALGRKINGEEVQLLPASQRGGGIEVSHVTSIDPDQEVTVIKDTGDQAEAA